MSTFDLSAQPPLPQPGQEPWGEDLNACVVWLYEYVVNNDARIATNEERLAADEVRYAELEERIVALEAQKEHVFNSYPWQFSNQAPPATGNQIRLDNTDPMQATFAEFRKIDSDGADRTWIFHQLTPGDTFRISDWDNASVFYRFAVNGPPMVGPDSITVPVTSIGGAGVVPNAKVNVGFLISIII
jgi:hypothetical protein